MNRIPTPRLSLAYRALRDWAVWFDPTSSKDRHASGQVGRKLAEIRSEIEARTAGALC